MRGDRLLSLVLLLQARPGAVAPELAERLGVSVRTVLRDVEALSGAGIPVYTERGRNGGIRLLDTYRTGLAHLSRAEGAGLAVGQSRLAGDLGLGDALDTALEKLTGAGGGALRGGLADGRSHVLVDVDPWMRSGEAVPHLPAIHEALLRGRQLRLVYRDSEGGRTTRTVDPVGLVAKAGIWYLVTAGPATAGPATAGPATAESAVAGPALLRVARIETCTPLPDPAHRPPGFDLAAAWTTLRSGVESRPRDLRVVAEVDPAAAALARRVLGRHVTGAAQGTRLELAFTGVDHAVGSLLGLGARLEVLEPEAVRAALRTAALEVAALYQT
ncbi:helix-turn-helix transcriptional regulator [Dactylosporangium sp. NPDC051541]|uniref:helix-turn-helix transcriptional regulator n=1 Tax=Dactylosporangium sp. NPDC051541 TaxID=3363977 RepID=UPI00378ABE8C